MDTLTKTKVSTRTMAMAAIGAVGLVAAAAIGLSGGSGTTSGTSSCLVTVMRAPDSPNGLQPRGTLNQVVEKVLVGVPSTCQDQTLQNVGFFATSTINNLGTTTTVKAFRDSVTLAKQLGSLPAPNGTGWGAAFFGSPPSMLTTFTKGTTTTVFFTADTVHFRRGNVMQARMDYLKFVNTATTVRTLPLFGLQLKY